MTFSVDPDDLEKHMNAIVANEELLFGSEGYDHEDILNFEKHPRYSTGIILTKRKDLAGYAIMRTVRAGVVRILRLCVVPKHRKKGFGQSLHDAILLSGYEYRLRVPERWLEAQLWLRKAGWIAVGIAPDGIEFRTSIEIDPFVVS